MSDFIITDNKLEKYNGTDTEVKIPDNVKTIEINAFSCSENITVPETITDIGFGAFSNCKSLQSITLSKNVMQISEMAFRGCENLTICCPKSSYAQKYAKKNGIPFTII